LAEPLPIALLQKELIRTRPGGRGEADYQIRQALNLAPDIEKVKKLRAKVAQLLKDWAIAQRNPGSGFETPG
jgi:hypothetical protein